MPRPSNGDLINASHMLRVSQLEAIKDHADAKGLSQSAIVRQLLDLGLRQLNAIDKLSQSVS